MPDKLKKQTTVELPPKTMVQQRAAGSVLCQMMHADDFLASTGGYASNWGLLRVPVPVSE
jgi:hypothetical protein